MRKIDVRVTDAERKWMISFYKDLIEESMEAERPDLAERARKCAEELARDGRKEHRKKRSAYDSNRRSRGRKR